MIDAPVAHVWNTMLDHQSFEQRTSVFRVGSTYKGWRNQGDHIKFVDHNGEGMTSQIVENRQYAYLSTQHLWEIHRNEAGESVITAYDTPIYENYTFVEEHDATHLTITMDWLPEEYVSMMDKQRPEALEELKMICETNTM